MLRVARPRSVARPLAARAIVGRFGVLPCAATKAAVAVAVAVGMVLPAVLPAPTAAQERGTDLRRQILDSQRRLEEIRTERGRLQTELLNLRSRVEDVSTELRNIERQLSASRSVVAEIDFQTDALSRQVEQTSEQLARSRDQLRVRTTTLQERLREIYKRGALHTARVLLGAESFADLLNRYRYLNLIADLDRALVQRVRALESSLIAQSDELAGQLSELATLREAKLQEVRELRVVEDSRQQALGSYRSRASATQGRLAELERREGQVTALVDDLEQRRTEAERRRAVSGAPSPEPSDMGSGDAGQLPWPVEGDLVYRFGRDQRPNGTVLRWNGIGIAAPTGTPVRAVRAGTVVLAGPFEGYGPTVVLSHGDGFYTLYLYLQDVAVVEGRTVGEGQVIGTVGGADTPEGPHVEFQVRAPIGGRSPQAVDPLQWLRASGR